MREIEHGSFTPLVLSASGGMGPTASVFYKKLASMIATKHNKAYSKTLNWMRCRISCDVLEGIPLIQGTPGPPVVGDRDIELALIEGRVGQ